jgi:dolichyl-phosphate beta-glucosyltransferase
MSSGEFVTSQLGTLSVIVPAYNEQSRIEPTLRAIVQWLREQKRRFEVVVVDDGSRDETGTVVDDLRAELGELRLIRLARNHGKGYAVRAGVLNARSDLVLFCDADLATPIQELARLESAIADGAAVAIGSREARAEDVRVRARRYRRVVGRTFHALVEVLTVRGFRDTQCGFKLFRGAVAQDLFSRMCMDGYAFDVEVLLMAQRRGYRVAEVPVNWSHQPGSKVNLVTDATKMFWDLLRIRKLAMSGVYDAPHVASWAAPLNARGPEPVRPELS